MFVETDQINESEIEGVSNLDFFSETVPEILSFAALSPNKLNGHYLPIIPGSKPS